MIDERTKPGDKVYVACYDSVKAGEFIRFTKQFSVDGHCAVECFGQIEVVRVDHTFADEGDAWAQVAANAIHRAAGDCDLAKRAMERATAYRAEHALALARVPIAA